MTTISELEKLEQSNEVFNACTQDYAPCQVSTEYQCIIQYTDDNYDIPNHSFDTLREALAYAKEYYDAYQDGISHIEIWLQVTAWIDGIDAETIGENLVCYYKK